MLEGRIIYVIRIFLTDGFLVYCFLYVEHTKVAHRFTIALFYRIKLTFQNYISDQSSTVRIIMQDYGIIEGCKLV